MFNIFKKPKKIEKKPLISKEYLEFLLAEKEAKEPKTKYEKFCRFAGKLNINPPKAMKKKLEENIVFSTLNVSTASVFSTSISTFFILTLLALIISYLIVQGITMVVILLILPLAISYYIYSYPSFKAQVLKIQTGDEAIKIILYMVIYLKLHPSFEGAVNFATSHAKGSISTDIKKAMWDLQTGKYKTIEEALSAYMPKWVIWNEDFVRSLTLLYGVLIEPSEQGRERILKKSLSFLLTNTHRKMKEFVENISAPITILHTMGMLLPVMGLMMFPIISMFMHDTVNPFYLGFGYVVVLPLLTYFYMNRILLKRPSAFMVPDISSHPDLPPPSKFMLKIGKKKIFVPVLPLALIIGLLIMSYGILHFVDLYSNLHGANLYIQEKLIKKEAEMTVANILSGLSITIGVGASAFSYFYLKSFQRIKIRNRVKNIENEFQIGLFSLGNYLSEGYPIETAIQKSLDEYEKLGMRKRPVFFFFSKLLYNIKSFGKTFEDAIFNKEIGIILYFPSKLIGEILRILSDASQKSSRLLGSIAKTIGSYLEDLNAIEAKIRELLEDVRSGLRVQSSFVIPMICGVTASLGIFMLNMLRLLSCQLQEIEKALGLGLLQGGTYTVSSILNELIGSFAKVIPMTLLQAIIGIYTVEIITLFAILLNGIENGFDETSRNYMIAQTLLKGVIFFVVVNIISLLLFGFVILQIMESSTGGPIVCD